MESQRKELLVFGLDVSGLSNDALFIFSASGAFFCYLFYGYIKEYLFKFDGFQPHGFYLIFVQFGFYSIFGFTEWKLILKESSVKIPIKTYFLLAFMVLMSMALYNFSLGYLNFPTYVLFKSCKLIPVMIGGILIQNKKYHFFDYLSCILMNIGLSWFILADREVQTEFSYIGVLSILMALCCSAIIPNTQEKMMKQYFAPNSEVVSFTYAIGCAYMFVWLLVTGNFIPGFLYYLQDPFHCYGFTMLYSVTGYGGVVFVLVLKRTVGALTAVTVTTCRKVVTIILSFLLFPKPFTMQYVWSGVIFLLGIALNMYQRNKPKID